jgi:hypothetical protein
MSRVQSTSSTPRAVPAAPAAVQPAVAPAAAPEESLFGAQQLTAAPTSSLSDVQTRNLVVDATLTATELSLGKEVPLSQNLSAVFAEGVEGVAPTADKIVVTGITLENVYSNVPSRVSVSANLFQNQAQQNSLVNDAGWLYSAASSELAAEASEHVSYAGNDGKFVQLCSLLPMESSRHNECAIYTPTSSSLNSRHLQDYGNISSKDQVRHHNVFVFFCVRVFCVLVLTPHNVSTLQLWNGIVAVTDSTYYVPAESVVCKVIEKNWDKFGFHPQQVRDISVTICLCCFVFALCSPPQRSPHTGGNGRGFVLPHREAHRAVRGRLAVLQRHRAPAVHRHLRDGAQAPPAVQRGAVQQQNAQRQHAAQGVLPLPADDRRRVNPRT